VEKDIRHLGAIIPLADRVRESAAESIAAKLVVAWAETMSTVRRLGETMDEYRTSLAAHYPMSTIATYGHKLIFIEAYIGRDQVLEEINISGLEAMLVDYRETHNDNTSSQFCSNVRNFFEWCVRRRYLDYSPAAALRGPRRPDPNVRGLSIEQALALLAHLQQEVEPTLDWRDIRNHGMIRYKLATGSRRTETALQTWNNIDLQARQIKILGKGKKVRVIPIYLPLVKRLEQLKEVCGTPNGPVFPAELAKQDTCYPMHPYSINMIFSRWVQDELGFDISPHDLRHAFAQALNEVGVGIEEVSELLGHANILVTQRYYGRPSQERLRKAVDQLPFDDAL
jgi:integrase/recombinase XerC